MRQRNLYGIVILLGLGLTALPGQVPAQIAGTPAPSASWATAGSEPAPGDAGAPAVIATTRSEKPVLSPEASLPPIDDGLKPIMSASATATARPGPPPDPPPPLLKESVQRALYSTTTDPAPGKIDPEVIPAAAGPRELSPAALPGSMLALEMTGPSTAAPGQTLSCVVIARNIGSVVLAGVQVDLPLPESVRLIASEPIAEHRINAVSWVLGNLEAGAERRLKIDVATNNPGDLHLRPEAHFAAALGLHTSIVRPPFALTVSGPTTATVGGPIVWKIQVANHTAAPLRRVTLTCKLTAGLSHSQGDTIETEAPQGLAPGQVYSIDLNVLAIHQGRQVISLTASAEGETTAQAQGVVMVNELTLPLSLQGPRHARIGEELAFALNLTNPGNATSGPIRLTQGLPLGLEFTSASSGGLYNPATQTIAWALDSLPGGGRHEATFKARAKQTGDWALATAVQVEGMADVPHHARGSHHRPAVADGGSDRPRRLRGD